VLIRDDAEQAAYDKSLHPGLLHGWNGGANVGFSLARGNSETTNLALAINAVHATLDDKITLYLTSIDTNNELATPSTVANLVTAGIRYDRNMGPRLFAFVGADFMSNALQGLDLRGVYGGGLGFHAIKSDNTTLDFLAGLNYTHEVYSNGPLVTPATVPATFISYGVTNRFAALTLGEELMHKAGKSTVISEKLYFFPDLSNTGEYRGTFDLGTVTKISKWLGWQNQFSDIYVSNPPEGAKKNDLILTTGLNFSFTH
jgi:putative salt-induced outer membrane protein YdiY